MIQRWLDLMSSLIHSGCSFLDPMIQDPMLADQCQMNRRNETQISLDPEISALPVALSFTCVITDMLSQCDVNTPSILFQLLYPFIHVAVKKAWLY